uniref:Uncharacterized protein n=1 Tax=viral metagenome TaxID=1070528 RepID=A0A6M3KLU5_9ZZZZ
MNQTEYIELIKSRDPAIEWIRENWKWHGLESFIIIRLKNGKQRKIYPIKIDLEESKLKYIRDETCPNITHPAMFNAVLDMIEELEYRVSILPFPYDEPQYKIELQDASLQSIGKRNPLRHSVYSKSRSEAAAEALLWCIQEKIRRKQK